jgi:hypothetical protein
MEKSTAQTIVKVFAVLAWIGAAFSVLGGLGMLMGGGLLGSAAMVGGDGAASLLGALGFGAGIFLIAIGVLYVFVGRGLWQHQTWARIVTIIFGVIALFAFPLGTVIGAIQIWLFGFQKDVKGLFK